MRVNAKVSVFVAMNMNVAIHSYMFIIWTQKITYTQRKWPMKIGIRKPWSESVVLNSNF